MVTVVFFLLFLPAAAGPASQEWPEAQEPIPARPHASSPEREAGITPADPVTDMLLLGIGYYRSDIGPHSISRCPFKTSCSRFAQISLRRWGLLGLVPFTDRFLYRENVQTAFLYLPCPATPSGTIKSDDDFYLPAP